MISTFYIKEQAQNISIITDKGKIIISILNDDFQEVAKLDNAPLTLGKDSAQQYHLKLRAKHKKEGNTFFLNHSTKLL